jgi:SAM-dependent methyltransferase
MAPEPSIVESYYDDSAEREWARLERHRTEFAVTMRALSEYLPPAPATVLDTGGGPGRYSIALAQMGYTVTLLDLSSGSLEYARGKAAEAEVELAAYVHGDALDLSHIPEESYDAVLLMGPLYHLLEEADRRRAVCEARRVLKTGGIANRARAAGNRGAQAGSGRGFHRRVLRPPGRDTAPAGKLRFSHGGHGRLRGRALPDRGSGERPHRRDLGGVG